MYDQQHYSYYRRLIRLRKRDEVLTDKLMDFANLASVALIFSQLADGLVPLDLFLGISLFFVIYAAVWYYLSRFH